MIELDADGDVVTNLLERRWFAAAAAVRAAQSECDVLRELIELAESSWRGAYSRLARLEAVRDFLSEELAGRDAIEERRSPFEHVQAVSSSA